MAKSNKKSSESLKRKHWSIKCHESFITRNPEGHFCLNVEGGAELGLFPYIGEIRQDRIHYQSGKLYHGELILEVNNKRVPGMIKKDVIALIKRSADPVSLVTVKQNATITKDIRQYLATRFTKNSLDSELQHQIRENLHMRVVPCTTREPQAGEREGIDYKFISVDDFKKKEKAGELLESGNYQGNFYGTPKPPADPPSSANFPAYSRSPASMGYSKEAVLPTSNSLSPSVSGQHGATGYSNQHIPKNLGPLPKNWEIAYTENNEKYFIDHNTGTTHWLDPRLTQYMKGNPLDCAENELPFGWEKVNDPVYGTYYIDHINRLTQYENPVVDAKRRYAGSQLPHRYNDAPPIREPPPSFQSAAAIEKQREAEAAAMWPDAGLRDYPDSENYPYPYAHQPTEQDLEADLQGEQLFVELTKTQQGFGFTIIGGDRPGELLQIKSIVRGSVADSDGRLQVGDVLVRINGISVLTYNHRKVVDLFQSIPLGTNVQIEIRRGYPLPDFVPVDGLPSYNESNQVFGGSQPMHGHLQMWALAQPERVVVQIIKGPLGFGFSLGESDQGPIVKMIMDHPRCAQLREGDVLLEVNGENVRNYVHNELVTVLKRCAKGNQASFLVLRQSAEEQLPSYPGSEGYGEQRFDKGEPFQFFEIRLMRQVSGFGFRIIGGREEGSQATIGAIVAGGAADLDGRLQMGDEITHINGRSVLNASHRDVIHLMGEAAAQGEVVLRIQRKMPLPESMLSPPTSGPVMGVAKGDWFPQQQLYPQHEGGVIDGGQFADIPKGIRDVVIERPNEQTSFGFVLQSNTLRAGCMICRLVPDSPADKSGLLYMYDELLAVNKHDVSSMDHSEIVGLIKSSGIMIQLTVQQPEDVDVVARQQMIEDQQQFGMSPGHQPMAPGGVKGAGHLPNDKAQFQDFPGNEEDQPPLISGNISDIASDDEEIHHIDIKRTGGGFGFSIRGGAEYNSALCVLRIADNGAAEKDGRLKVGDELLEINGNSTEGMLHSDAITIIKHGGDIVKLIVRRMPEEQFIGSGNPKVDDGTTFSPTVVQTKDRYTQDYMNSITRDRDRRSRSGSRSGSGDPKTPPPQ